MPKDDIGGGNIIGKVAYIGCDNKYILGDHVYKLTSKVEEISTLFFAYLINSHAVGGELKKKVAGSAQLGLGRKSVEEQDVNFPKDKNEQSAIAGVLANMDTESEKLESQLLKYQNIKQGDAGAPDGKNTTYLNLYSFPFQPPKVGQLERKTQNRIIGLFRDRLGYDYLGNWEEREGNSNVEQGYLRPFLTRSGYSETLISKAIDELKKAAGQSHLSLYDLNKDIYSLLRYGIKVREGLGRASARTSATRKRSTSSRFSAQCSW